MKAAVISLGSVSSQWIAEAMKKYFEEVDMLDIKHIEIALGNGGTKVLYKRKPLKKYDCIYPKGSHKYADLLRSIVQLTKTQSYSPISDRAFTEGHDKLLTHLSIENSNIPSPKTFFCATIDNAKNLIKELNFPLVMKFPKGTHGKGVMFVDSIESANSIFDALGSLKQPFIIQEYVETGGEDIRAFVVGDKVVAAMKRKAQENEKRSNVHAGGSAEAVELDATTKKIAVRAAEALGASIAGVDLLMGAKGPLVMEVNLSPGLQGITKATNKDIADKIAKHLFEEAARFKHEINKKDADTLFDELGISKQQPGDEKEVFTNLDFRGNRILLPEFVTNITDFDEKKEIILKMRKGNLIISHD